MWPYYFLIIFPILIIALRKSSARYSNNALLGFFILLIVLLSVRADTIGVDLQNYKFYFEQIKDSSFSQLTQFSDWEIEYGFILYCWLFSRLTVDFQLFLAVTAIISIFPVMWYYRKESESELLTISIFLILNFFRFYFSGIRQGMAIAFVPLVYYYCKKRKIIPFLVFVAAAYFFHQSSFIMLLMFPLYKLRLSRKHLVVILFIIVITYLAKSTIFSSVVTLMSERYQERYGEVTETDAITMTFLFLLMMLFSFLIVDENKLDNDTNCFRNFLVVSVIIQVFSGVSTIAMRLNYYYLFFLPLLLPRVIVRSSSSNQWLANVSWWVMSSFFIVYYIVIMVTPNSILEIFPYSPFWNV